MPVGFWTVASEGRWSESCLHIEFAVGSPTPGPTRHAAIADHRHRIADLFGGQSTVQLTSRRTDDGAVGVDVPEARHRSWKSGEGVVPEVVQRAGEVAAFSFPLDPFRRRADKFRVVGRIVRHGDGGIHANGASDKGDAVGERGRIVEYSRELVNSRGQENGALPRLGSAHESFVV